MNNNKSKIDIQISGLSNNSKTVVVTTIYSDGSQKISRVPRKVLYGKIKKRGSH